MNHLSWCVCVCVYRQCWAWWNATYNLGLRVVLRSFVFYLLHSISPNNENREIGMSPSYNKHTTIRILPPLYFFISFTCFPDSFSTPLLPSTFKTRRQHTLKAFLINIIMALTAEKNLTYSLLWWVLSHGKERMQVPITFFLSQMHGCWQLACSKFAWIQSLCLCNKVINWKLF